MNDITDNEEFIKIMDVQGKDILTQQDLYDYLPLGKTSIQKLLQQKIIPATKIGRNYFITKRKLLAWIDDNAGKELYID